MNKDAAQTVSSLTCAIQESAAGQGQLDSDKLNSLSAANKVPRPPSDRSFRVQHWHPYSAIKNQHQNRAWHHTSLPPRVGHSSGRKATCIPLPLGKRLQKARRHLPHLSILDGPCRKRQHLRDADKVSCRSFGKEQILFSSQLGSFRRRTWSRKEGG